MTIQELLNKAGNQEGKNVWGTNVTIPDVIYSEREIRKGVHEILLKSTDDKYPSIICEYSGNGITDEMRLSFLRLVIAGAIFGIKNNYIL